MNSCVDAMCSTFKLISKCIDGKGFSGTKRYFGDLGKTLRTAGSNVLFAVVTEISDSVLKGAETSGFNGMVQFILLLCRVIPAHFVIDNSRTNGLAISSSTDGLLSNDDNSIFQLGSHI
ncbi:hypothetical protein CK203_000231 [Vitis vinifera]|uniref:Uncharacterized protein n=1 Tax=Vitis vinifera TaxID=29760 RepID=A0A438KQQ2_VITVI|nr:hypothetical protein CK203_000231 [Vitis vinifera]